MTKRKLLILQGSIPVYREKLFNLLGKQVLNTAFTSNGVQDIPLPQLAKGVYVIQLQTAKGKLNKKIILE